MKLHNTTLRSKAVAINVKKRNKAIALMFVIILLMNCLSMSVSAAVVDDNLSVQATNKWNLDISQISVTYFKSGANGSSLNSSWSIPRQNAWISCSTLVNNFNKCITTSRENDNVIKQLEYIYDNSSQDVASSYGTQWNRLKSKINSLVIECEILCGYSSSVPVVNGSKVTTSEYQNLQSRCQNLQNELTQLKTEINNSYDNAKDDVTASFNVLSNDLFNVFNSLWNGLGNMIKIFGTGQSSTSSILGISWTSNDIENISNTVSGVVKTFAYAVAVILFGINVTTTALQYELLTLRGGIRIFVRVLLVKFWIDLAIKICLYVLNIINGLVVSIFELFTINSVFIFGENSLGYVYTPNTGVSFIDSFLQGISKVLNFLSALTTQLPVFILLGLAIWCVCSVIVKIISRAFELTCLVSLSPIFFATLVGEETKQYFKKFLSAFLSTAGYLVYMAIVYAVATTWIKDCNTHNGSSLADLGVWLMSIGPRYLIMLACCSIMKKPPKVLTSLVEG